MTRILTVVSHLFVAIGLFSPVLPIHAQETIPPEGIIFTAEGSCVVSPDEMAVAVSENGVFSLPNGEKRFELGALTGQYDAVYSPDSRYLAVNGVGLYDLATGELLIESLSMFPLFSPDSRFYIEYDLVYDLSTLEVVADLDRYGNGVSSFIIGEFINDGRWFTTTKTAMNAPSFFDATTWQPVIEVDAYPQHTKIVFNADFTRYAVSDVGVFSLENGERLFELPEGIPAFSSDSTRLLIIPLILGAPPENMTFNFYDGETGGYLTQFSVPWTVYASVLQYAAPISRDFTKIVMPDIAPPSSNALTAYQILGWRLIDIKSGNLIKRVVSNTLRPAYGELGIPSPLDTINPIIQGRYVVAGVGVYDAETNELVWASEDFSITLTAGGAYALTQYPCTVWLLP